MKIGNGYNIHGMNNKDFHETCINPIDVVDNKFLESFVI